MCGVLAGGTGDPLALSLALDVLEDILAAGDRAKHARAMAREGALAALVGACSAHVTLGSCGPDPSSWRSPLAVHEDCDMPYDAWWHVLLPG